jgi:hypothetical protein
MRRFCGLILTEEDQSTGRTTCPNVTWSNTNVIRTALGLNTATCLLSYGTPHYNVKPTARLHLLKAKVRLFLALIKRHTVKAYGG